MNKKLTLFWLIFAIPFLLNAQTINMNLPEGANKNYAFILNKGIKQDTIQKGRISAIGAVTIHIPEKDKGYVGMGSMRIEGSPVCNLIINKENFTVSQGADMRYTFKDSKENDFLYSIMQDKKFPVADTTMYASHFIGIIRYMQQLDQITTKGGSLRDAANVRSYALDHLNMEQLYTSSVWHNVVDGLTKFTTDQKQFGEDMVHIMKRITSQEVFEHLANNLLTITDQYGWDDAFDVIVPYMQESGRIKVPIDKMFVAFSLAKIRKGSTPPPLEGLATALDKSDAHETLLVFYQPDCENCHAQLELLIKEYPKLKEQGVRVISISSDSGKDSFAQDVKRFPWADSDKLCDFKGFAGKNFINYGIMGTPTFFLLDENKKVIKRYALVADIDFSSNIEVKNSTK